MHAVNTLLPWSPEWKGLFSTVFCKYFLWYFLWSHLSDWFWSYLFMLQSLYILDLKTNEDQWTWQSCSHPWPHHHFSSIPFLSTSTFFPFFLIPISPSRAPVIISVTQSGAHFHISPPQNRDTTTLLYLSVFIQLIFHTLTSNIAALCSWDNRAEH